MSLADRLKQARLGLGLTLSDVEERTGIGSSTLSEFETAKREPRLAQLKQLGQAYRRALSFFLDDAELPAEVVLWRQRPTAPKAEELQAELIKLAQQYRNLELWCDDTTDLDLPLAKGTASEFNFSKAERLAHDFRNRYSLGERPGQALLRVLEEVCGVKVFHIPFEPTGSAACSYSETYGAAVLLNASNVRWRRNFDLAHELFHLLTWTIFREVGSSVGIEASEQEEKLATCFARNLLMPQEALRLAVDLQLAGRKKLGFDDLFEVARQFDVSVEALLWQMGFLYAIPKERISRALEDLRGQMRYWEDRERDEPPMRPLRYRALARQALRKGMISAGRYAEYVGVSRREAMQTVEQDAEDDAEVEVVNP